MKTIAILRAAVAVALHSAFCLQPSAWLQAATTINLTNHFAYGANVGWVECRGDVANGAVIGEYICSGYIYAANVGWIALGSGTPANGIQYQNNSASDWGVNHDGLGNLRGYAWGANIGWINFENTGGAKVDLLTGKLSGHAWSANCGWISLSNAVALVQTDTMAPGADTDGDGLPDAWERLRFGNLAQNGGGDPDGDGMNNLQEYLADTNPLDPNDLLRITAYSVSFPGYEAHDLTWTSRPTRFYRLHLRNSFGPFDVWQDVSGLIPGSAGTTTSGSVGIGGINGERYLRVEAVRPLSP
jgi:hypothetical protein